MESLHKIVYAMVQGDELVLNGQDALLAGLDGTQQRALRQLTTSADRDKLLSVAALRSVVMSLEQSIWPGG